MDTVLLIGGTGLLGPSTVRELEALGREVVCINRRGVHPTGGIALAVDRNSTTALQSAFSRYESFCLVDMIPYTAQQAFILLEALEGKQPQLTAVSSIDVYKAYNILHSQGKAISSLQAVPLTESSDLRERISFQSIEYDKLNVERLYWSYFDDYMVLRMPAIYGLPDTSRVNRYVDAFNNNREIRMNPDMANWRFSRSLNSNCAHAVSLCVGLAGREIFNVAEEQHYSEREWCLKLASLMGVDARLTLCEDAATPFNMNTQQHWTVDSSKLRNSLGYKEKYDTEQGLLDTLTSLKEPMS